MSLTTQVDNIYLIDTRMFGFANYQSSYLVKGKELVLIDTGIPPQLETVRAAIRQHGFSVADISSIFLTHCEHPDHAGNAGALVKENPRIKVYIHSAGLEYLTQPAIESGNRSKVMLPQMAARFGQQLPVPRSSICFLNDGDIFDIGNGENLRIMFTAGHQPSGLVIFEEKSEGLFINDLVGAYFADADFSLVLTPPRSDVLLAKKMLEKLLKTTPSRLYLGHFGFCENPADCIRRTLTGIQRILDIAEECLREERPEEIESRVLASKLPEIEKLRKIRGNVLYEYVRDELITHHSTYFAEYYLRNRPKK